MFQLYGPFWFTPLQTEAVDFIWGRFSVIKSDIHFYIMHFADNFYSKNILFDFNVQNVEEPTIFYILNAGLFDDWIRKKAREE